MGSARRSPTYVSAASRTRAGATSQKEDADRLLAGHVAGYPRARGQFGVRTQECA